jgi:hypothetical protein
MEDTMRLPTHLTSWALTFVAASFYGFAPVGTSVDPLMQAQYTASDPFFVASLGFEKEIPSPIPMSRQHAALSDTEYLCQIYKRTPKKDGTGNFEWKDPKAAARRKMEICEYVIGGVEPELLHKVASAGRAMESEGLRWGITSCFRDDYRQSLIKSGIRAKVGRSNHRRGKACDIVGLEPTDNEDVWAWIDRHSEVGLGRPFPGRVKVAGKFRWTLYDPAHTTLITSGEYVAQHKTNPPAAKIAVKPKKHGTHVARK